MSGLTVSCQSARTGDFEDLVVVQPLIRGRVEDSTGKGLSGVTVSANGGGTTAVTNGAGDFEVHVPYNWSGQVAAQYAALVFDPPEYTFSGRVGDVIHQRFEAAPAGSSVHGPDNLSPAPDAVRPTCPLDPGVPPSPIRVTLGGRGGSGVGRVLAALALDGGCDVSLCREPMPRACTASLCRESVSRAYMEYFSRSRRAMISFCISLVPSPMIISGASR